MADALTLGSHYEYDAVKIKAAYNGDIQRFMAPGEEMGGETHGVGWGARNYNPGRCLQKSCILLSFVVFFVVTGPLVAVLAFDSRETYCE